MKVPPNSKLPELSGLIDVTVLIKPPFNVSIDDGLVLIIVFLYPLVTPLGKIKSVPVNNEIFVDKSIVLKFVPTDSA